MAELALIISIVRNGWGDRVLQASCQAGSEGCTIVLGRGVGVHEKQKILGIPIEPEKEIVLSLTYPDKTEAVLEAIVQAGELEKPGTGIAFVVPVERLTGVVHHCDESCLE
jgi:nitrogen regulatory protein P-II 1